MINYQNYLKSMGEKKCDVFILFIGLSLLMFFFSCHKKSEQKILFENLESKHTGIDFRNELDVNLELNIFNYMYYYNGAGTAVADLNNDGLPDIILSSMLGDDS